MKLGYVDTSCFVAVAFGERGASALMRRLTRFDALVSSNLLDAEFRCACARETVEPTPELLDAVSWILPDRPLSEEITRVLAAGRVRGADCWHLATALYVAQDPADLSFLTLDARQMAVAETLGFRA